MSQQSMALVSPRDHRVATFDQSASTTASGRSVAMLDGRSITVGDYLARYPGTEFVTFDNERNLSSRLSDASERSCTLDFCMMLFDPDLSPPVKQRAAEELDELLLSEGNRDYTLDIFLAFPLPTDSDFESAKAATKNGGEAYRMVCLLEETRQRAEFAFSAWLSVREHPMVKQVGEQRVRGKLILSGVCRRAVIDLTTKSLLDSHVGTLMLDTKQHLDARVVQVFLREYATKLPQGVRTVRSRDEAKIDPLPELEYERIRQHDLIRGNADSEQERAVREVDKIAELFVEGNDKNAKKFRDTLVARQSAEADHSHLVKSLCNIASKCTTSGKYGAAAECLTIALEYERGVDSRLFVQMSNLFKDLKKYEEASECLRKAKPLSTNPSDRDVINRNLARLLVSRGEYVEALDAFRQLSDIETSPESRTSLATLLRKMGDLPAARSILEEVWSKYGTPQSFAGLAECQRQSGKLDKAIKKYKWLLTEMDLDNRTSKVFRVALSSLYRAFGKLDASRSILEQLHIEYPLDSSVQLQLAKVFRLLGYVERADELYQNSLGNLQETDQLASKLYQTACMTKGSAKGEPSEAGVILPEHRTLFDCSVALRHIVDEDFNALRNILPLTKGPIKLHEDFRAVLRYHSQVLLGCDVNPKGDIRINRIRKHGLEDMKMAVRAIDQRNFKSALLFEQRTCLRVA